jgi:hypothetical protein
MTWQLGDVTMPHYAGWVAIQTVAPNEITSPRAYFDLVCTDAKTAPAVVPPPRETEPTGTETPGAEQPEQTEPVKPAPAITAKKLADLQVRLSIPRVAHAGDTIGAAIEVHALNYGESGAPGTADEMDPAAGYTIEIVLSTDQRLAPGAASYKPNFAEDVLLQGGRINNTYDLPPGAAAVYQHMQGGKGKIPDDTPPGVYYLGARIDPANKVAESDEKNNIVWERIEILAKRSANAVQPIRELPQAP